MSVAPLWPACSNRIVVLCALALCNCAVDVTATQDAGVCAPSPDYFVSDVWPRFFDTNRCATSGTCHSVSDGHGYLRLWAPERAPAPGTQPSTWPVGWRENYLSAIQLLDCAQPAASRLLTVPEGQYNLHPPGPVISDRQTAATVIETWIEHAR